MHHGCGNTSQFLLYHSGRVGCSLTEGRNWSRCNVAAVVRRWSQPLRCVTFYKHFRVLNAFAVTFYKHFHVLNTFHVVRNELALDGCSLEFPLFATWNLLWYRTRTHAPQGRTRNRTTRGGGGGGGSSGPDCPGRSPNT